mmetsp:Transcript_21607/g.60798  ORF Transcript_21607/g.60798 Transcript_21607/m.60798 type:complete len:234 (+) Transcript_21607:107-808(+)
MSGALRSVPSPLQGTSHRMRWNLRPGSALSRRMSGKFWASCWVTSSAGVFMRCVWWMSRLHRWASTSLATTRPAGSSTTLPWWIISSSWKVLLPGEAHVSSTRWPGRTSRNSGGSMDTASCRVMPPASFSRLRNSCILASAETLRIWLRPYCICHARPSGYHGSWKGGRRGSPSSSVAPAAFLSSPTRSRSRRSRRRRANWPVPLRRKVTGRGLFRQATRASHSSSGTRPCLL